MRSLTVLGFGLALVAMTPAAGSAHDVSVRDAAPVLRSVRPIEVGETVPTESFVDQNGKPFSFAALRRTPYVMAFIYTRCSDARECPLVSAKFGQLQQRTAPKAMHLVEVTLDPTFDTPAVLRAYGRRFGEDPARWTFLTGDPKRILDFAARFGVIVFGDRPSNLIHSERTVIVDGDGVVRQLIDDAAWDPGDIIAQVRVNERLAANPIARLHLWLSSVAVAIFGIASWLLYRLGRAIRRAA